MSRAGATLRPVHPVPRSLARLADEFGFESGDDLGEVELRGVTLAADAVADGDLFVALPGHAGHAAEEAGRAVGSGAVAVLTDPSGAADARGTGVPVLVTADPLAALGDVAAWIYRTDDDLPTLFAVTGSTGKTSVVHLLDALLTQLGTASAVVSTAERRIGDESVLAVDATPDAGELHGLLARMREEGARAAAIEVSVHAVADRHLDGTRFDVAGFTNLTPGRGGDDDLERSFAAALALFDPDRAERGVALVDGDEGRRIADESRIPVTTLAARGVAADWTYVVGTGTAEETGFVLTAPDGRSLTTSVSLFGAHMAVDAALAVVMLVESGIDLAAIDHVLAQDGGIDARVPGRAERLSGDRGPALLLEGGQTPAALAATLTALRAVTPGRVLVLLGADGRDGPAAWSALGSVAARGADEVVVTDHHPCDADPARVRSAVVAGARDAGAGARVHEIADPREAVRRAVGLAGEGDAILYAGPGHENHREVAGVKLPYSARTDSRLALQEAGWRPADAEPDDR